jgi:hypothetical protein
VTSKTTARFRTAFSELPRQIQRQAREAYRLFRTNPNHPGLRFRRVHPTEPIYSARITLHYRALGVQEGEAIVWFWIGSHAEYDDLLSRL